jgi:hypothetical protein
MRSKLMETLCTVMNRKKTETLCGRALDGVVVAARSLSHFFSAAIAAFHRVAQKNVRL